MVQVSLIHTSTLGSLPKFIMIRVPILVLVQSMVRVPIEISLSLVSGTVLC